MLGVLLSRRGSEKPPRNFPLGEKRRGEQAAPAALPPAPHRCAPSVLPSFPSAAHGAERGSAGRALPRAALRTHPSPAALPADRRLPGAPGQGAARAGGRGPCAGPGGRRGRGSGAEQRPPPPRSALIATRQLRAANRRAAATWRGSSNYGGEFSELAGLHKGHSLRGKEKRAESGRGNAQPEPARWFKAGNSLASHRHGRIQHRPASPREECLAHITLILAPELGFTQPPRPSPRSLPPAEGRGANRHFPPHRGEKPCLLPIYIYTHTYTDLFSRISWKRLAKQRLLVRDVPALLWKTSARGG